MPFILPLTKALVRAFPERLNGRMTDGMSTDVDLPRRRDAAGARAALLTAAQQLFSTAGYRASGLREIATRAGIDAALVRRYFGSKDRLYAAALADALDIHLMLDTPRARFGAHVVAYFLDGERASPNPLPMMLLAATDPIASEIALAVLQDQVIAPLATWIGGTDGQSRAARVSVICSGFFTYWKLLPLDAFAGGIDVATRRWLEETLQAAVDG